MELRLGLLKKSIVIFIIFGFINAILALIQVINNGSLGLQFLKESVFNLEMTGVAKIVLGNKPFIRPYGFFPHPNILGAYLMISIVLTIFYFRMFKASATNCSTWNIFTWIRKNLLKSEFFEKNKCSTRNNFSRTYVIAKIRKFLFHVEQLSKFMFSEKLPFALTPIQGILLFFPLLTLFLTFSKNAIMGLLTAFLVISYQIYLSQKGQKSLNFAYIKPFFVDKVLTKKNLLIFAIFVMILVNIKPSLSSLFSRSFDDRTIFQNVSRGTITENLILGVGIGQFVPSMDRYSKMPLLKWQYQPVHNVFSLIWSELGFIGIVLFLLFLWKLLSYKHIVPRFSNEIPRNYPSKCSTQEEILQSIKDIPPQKKCSTWNILWERCETIIDSHNIDNFSYYSVVFKGLAIAFIIMMLFDHYFWDIQQGMALWWIVLALV